MGKVAAELAVVDTAEGDRPEEDNIEEDSIEEEREVAVEVMELLEQDLLVELVPLGELGPLVE